jgi:hypothetical protein
VSRFLGRPRYDFHPCRHSSVGPSCTLGAGGAGEVGRDDVGGVAVEGAAGAVVAAGLAWVGMTGEVLDVAQAASGIERGGDGGVPQRVGRDALVLGARGMRAGWSPLPTIRNVR